MLSKNRNSCFNNNCFKLSVKPLYWVVKLKILCYIYTFQCYRHMFWIDHKYFIWFYFNSLFDFTGGEGSLDILGGPGLLLGSPDKKRRRSSTQVLPHELPDGIFGSWNVSLLFSPLTFLKIPTSTWITTLPHLSANCIIWIRNNCTIFTIYLILYLLI